VVFVGRLFQCVSAAKLEGPREGSKLTSLMPFVVPELLFKASVNVKVAIIPSQKRLMKFLAYSFILFTYKTS